MKIKSGLLPFAALILTLSSLLAAPVIVPISYQGRLTDSGNPASGTFDLRFAIFDLGTGGTELAAVTNTVTAASGVFNTVLNLDQDLFPVGDLRWLEIGVRTNGSAAAFATLTARQELTFTPYAVRAQSAGSVPDGTITSAMLADSAVTAPKIAAGAVSQLGTPNGSDTDAVQVTNGGLVGIGTNAPGAGLHVTAGASILAPNVRFQVQDETGSYTNLNATWDVAVSTNLLAVSGFSDSGITLLDISNPASPIIRSQIRDGSGAFTNLGGVRGLAFRGNLLAIAAEQDDAVTLITVTNPASPVRLAELRDGIGGFNDLNGAYHPALSGNLLAVAAFNDNAVTLVDVSNPASPILRSALQDGQFGFNDLAGAVHVALSGNLLAVVAFNDDAVTLVDVSTPASPVLRAVLKDGIGGFDQLDGVFGVAFSGNVLAIAAVNDDAVTLVDVSTPASPVLRAVLKNGVGGYNGLNSPRRLAFSGNLLAASASEDSAVTLTDVSNPASPVLKGVFRHGQAGIAWMNAPIGVVFAGTNLAVAASNSDGLTLISPTPASVSLATEGWMGVGMTVPAAPLHVVGNVIVEGATTIELRANRVALGQNTTANGPSSTAMGNFTTASAFASTAMGNSTTAGGFASTAMGNSTTASGESAVAMGAGTIASGFRSTAMGNSTEANADNSTAMGFSTIASGFASTALGSTTEASGSLSLAAGFRAKANHTGTFVWADGGGADFASAAVNQFLIRAAGGVGIGTNDPAAPLHVRGTGQIVTLIDSPNTTGTWLSVGNTSTGGQRWSIISTGSGNGEGAGRLLFFTSQSNDAKFRLEPTGSVVIDGTLTQNSDRNRKNILAPVDTREALEKVAALSLSRWVYRDDPDAPHLGPMAQDFHAAFGLGATATGIATVDADGVALAAIQGLNEVVREKDTRISALEKQNVSLENRLAALEKLVVEMTANETGRSR